MKAAAVPCTPPDDAAAATDIDCNRGVGMVLARAMHQVGLGARHLGLVQRCLPDAGGGMPASHAPLDASGTSGANSSTSLGMQGPMHAATGQIRLLRSSSPATCSAGSTGGAGGDLTNGPHHALGSIFASNQFASVSMHCCLTVLFQSLQNPCNGSTNCGLADHSRGTVCLQTQHAGTTTLASSCWNSSGAAAALSRA